MQPNPLQEDLDHILEHTGRLWDDLRGKRIFISGGTGFFGCWLLESFIWANSRLNLKASAVVLSRNPEAFIDSVPHLALDPAVSLLKGDVRSFAFPEGTFEFVIHAASDSSPAADVDTIVNGSRRMLEFARHCQAESFLFASSGAVYGRQPFELTHMPEDFAGSPQPGSARYAYADAKKTAELMCCEEAHESGIECKIARCFAFTGPYLPPEDFAIGNFIHDALRGLPVRVLGDGTAYRSYLYAADLTIWLWTILFRGASCRPYNVGSEADLTIRDLAERVAHLVGHGAKVEISRPPHPEMPSERYVPSTRRAQIELGLREWIHLDRAILSTAGSFHACRQVM